MKIVGLITEYNPFHNGHLYHLNKAKEITECEYTVTVMSGNFVQRGEPALVDKWTRAKMAVENGVDLVIELPVIYSVQSAEFFAYGAIKLLDSLGIVDYVVFGSEIGDLEILQLIAEVLHEEPTVFKKYIKQYLDEGHTFPLARSKALSDYFEGQKAIDLKQLSKILSSSNNILAIEYLKALKKINSKIIPKTVKRIGADYNSEELSGTFSSATSIRKQLLIDSDLNRINTSVPEPTLPILQNFIQKHKTFNTLDNYTDILLYLLRTIDKKNIKEILDVEIGLENRIIDCSSRYNSINKILDCINTKRYTYTRLQRIMIHLLLGIYGRDFKELNKFGPQYIRVLACNNKGLKLLSNAKKSSKLPIITKFASHKKIKNKILQKIAQYEVRATNIYYLGLKKYNTEKSNLDYLVSPYIVKK